MIAPIKLRSEEILRNARQALRQYRHDELLRRRAKLFGHKALSAARKAFDEQEKMFAGTHIEQKDWPERRRAVEQFLREISRGLT